MAVCVLLVFDCGFGSFSFVVVLARWLTGGVVCLVLFGGFRVELVLCLLVCEFWAGWLAGRYLLLWLECCGWWRD